MIKFNMIEQPDDESCGIASLFAIYQHYQAKITYPELVNEIERSLSGGTLAPLLGKHALQMGFKVTLYTNNLLLFDPTWFNHEEASNDFLCKKLQEQLRRKSNRYLGATHLFLDYLNLGGVVSFHIINVDLIEKYLLRKIPIVTSLNATYLYGSCRDRFDKQGNAIEDDTGGFPTGHFVVLIGYDRDDKSVLVADPYLKNTLSGTLYYKVPADRLINAIMLGVSTYDGNMLIIEPKT